MNAPWAPLPIDLAEVAAGTQGPGWSEYRWDELPQLSMRWHPCDVVCNRGAATYPLPSLEPEVPPLWHGIPHEATDAAIAKVRDWLLTSGYKHWGPKVGKVLIVIASHEEVKRITGRASAHAEMIPNRRNGGLLEALIILPLPHSSHHRIRAERQALATLLIHELEHVPQTLRFAESVPNWWRNFAEACAEHRAQATCGVAVSMEYAHCIAERLPFGLFNRYGINRNWASHFAYDGYHLFAFVDQTESCWPGVFEEAWQFLGKPSRTDPGSWFALSAALEARGVTLADAWERYARALVVPDPTHDTSTMAQLRKHGAPWLASLHLDCGRVTKGCESASLQPFGAAVVEVLVGDENPTPLEFRVPSVSTDPPIIWRISHLLPGSAHWNSIGTNTPVMLSGGLHRFLAVPVFEGSGSLRYDILEKRCFIDRQFRCQKLTVAWG